MKKTLLLLSLLCSLSVILPAADLSVTAASVVPGARAKTVVGTAGATITAGQLLYLDSTTGTYKLADSNASATTAQVVGIAASGASSGQPVVVVTEDDDLTVGATLSMSAPVYVLSATAGAIAPSADIATGHYPAVVFIAKSTTKAIFKIVRGTAPATAAVFDLGDTPRLALLPPPFFKPLAARVRADLALAA